jgi:ABC-type proline/glycine betaine transport system ATPase subunit
MEKGLIRTTTNTLYLDGVPHEREIKVSFGKNGHGLTTELTEIGKLIEEQSKSGEVFLEESFIDALDDVYELKFKVCL